MDSSIKNLTITGVAATVGDTNATGKPRRAGSRRKRSLKDDDLDETSAEGELLDNSKNIFISKNSDGADLQVGQKNISHISMAIMAKPIMAKPIMAKPNMAKPMPTPTPNTPIPNPSPMPTQTHVIMKPKEVASVILKPPKTNRVKLQPKLQSGASTSVATTSVNKTRKARRIHLSTATLSNRITRAKKVKEISNNTSSSQIREYLIKKGVIQAKSKAPDSMLRSMYSDFNMLKDNHAL
jgi:hypothetical protein